MFKNRRLNYFKAQNKLTELQESAILELYDQGYKLEYVRLTDLGELAIASNKESIVAIDAEGEIDYDPNITLRR